MSRHNNPVGAKDAGRVERVARHLALKGEAEVGMVLAIARRAEALLVDPGFATLAAAEKATAPAPFTWEAAELFPVGTPVSLWLGSVDDFATGEGLTIHFAVAAARSEGEFRRRLAAEMGAGLANRARVALGIDALVPFLPLFVTPALREVLIAFERGEGPAAFSFFARHHANYS
ncbi:MAG: hypothetical protein ACK40O_01450 [Allosphingosinicella sp.]